jgi:predicted ATPase
MSAIKAHLNQLVATNLVHLAQFEPEIEYLFRHALVQQAAYESLLRHDRRRLHLAAGQALEQLYPERRAEQAALIAHHFDEAGEAQLAFPYLLQAADCAAQRYANAEAIALYTRALELASAVGADSALYIHLYRRRGRALEVSGRHHAALENYEAMEAEAARRGDRALELAALVGRARLYVTVTPEHDLDTGGATAQRALNLARAEHDQQAEAWSLWTLIHYHSYRRNDAEAIACGEQALAIARRLEQPELLAYLLNDLAYQYAPNEPAATYAAEARTLWRTLGNLPMLADNLSSIAQLEFIQGHTDQALANLEEAYRISASIDNYWGQAWSRWHQANYLAEFGDFDEAMCAYAQARDLAERGGFVAVQMLARTNPAVYLHTAVGEYARALALAREALAIAEDRLPEWRPTMLAAIARTLIAAGAHAEAKRTIEEAYRLAGNSQDAFVSLATAEAGLALAVQRPAAALERPLRYLPAPDQFVQVGHVQLLIFLGQALIAVGRETEAEALLTRAHAVAARIGSRRLLWPISAVQAELAARRGDEASAQALRAAACEHAAYIAAHIAEPVRQAAFMRRAGGA